MSLGHNNGRCLFVGDKVKGFPLLVYAHCRNIGDFLISEDNQPLLLGILKIACQLQTGAVGIRNDNGTLQRCIISGYLYEVKVFDKRSDFHDILFFHMHYPFSSTFFRY